MVDQEAEVEVEVTLIVTALRVVKTMIGDPLSLEEKIEVITDEIGMATSEVTEEITAGVAAVMNLVAVTMLMVKDLAAQEAETTIEIEAEIGSLVETLEVVKVEIVALTEVHKDKMGSPGQGLASTVAKKATFREIAHNPPIVVEVTEVRGEVMGEAEENKVAVEAEEEEAEATRIDQQKMKGVKVSGKVGLVEAMMLDGIMQEELLALVNLTGEIAVLCKCVNEVLDCLL